MPSSTPKQHRLMAAVANNPAVSKKTGVPQSVGQDFMAADAGTALAKASPGDMQRQLAQAQALRRKGPRGGMP